MSIATSSALMLPQEHQKNFGLYGRTLILKEEEQKEDILKDIVYNL